MEKQNLNLEELMDLIDLEAYRGIIDRELFLRLAMTKGIPRIINDVRGALRLTVDREGEDFSVTQYPTDLSNESLGEIYSAGIGHKTDVDMAA